MVLIAGPPGVDSGSVARAGIGAAQGASEEKCRECQAGDGPPPSGLHGGSRPSRDGDAGSLASGGQVAAESRRVVVQLAPQLADARRRQLEAPAQVERALAVRYLADQAPLA